MYTYIIYGTSNLSTLCTKCTLLYIMYYTLRYVYYSPRYHSLYTCGIIVMVVQLEPVKAKDTGMPSYIFIGWPLATGWPEMVLPHSIENTKLKFCSNPQVFRKFLFSDPPLCWSDPDAPCPLPIQ